MIVNQLIIPTSVPPKLSQESNNTTAIINIGASSHYGECNVEKYCSKIVNPSTPNPVQVTNGKKEQSAKKVKFNLAPQLSNEAQREHTSIDLKTWTLVSVGQLYDDD